MPCRSSPGSQLRRHPGYGGAGQRVRRAVVRRRAVRQPNRLCDRDGNPLPDTDPDSDLDAKPHPDAHPDADADRYAYP